MSKRNFVIFFLKTGRIWYLHLCILCTWQMSARDLVASVPVSGFRLPRLSLLSSCSILIPARCGYSSFVVLLCRRIASSLFPPFPRSLSHKKISRHTLWFASLPLLRSGFSGQVSRHAEKSGAGCPTKSRSSRTSHRPPHQHALRGAPARRRQVPQRLARPPCPVPQSSDAVRRRFGGRRSASFSPARARHPRVR